MIGLLRDNYQNFKIFFTFLLLWFSVQFGSLIEDVVAYFMVITLGILHGANDLLIMSKNKKGASNFVKNLTVYLSIIIGCIVIFLLNPLAAILLFIVISAYHFGEEHFSDDINISTFFNVVFYLFYGLLIFAMIFYTSLIEVNEIMLQLVGREFTSVQIAYLLYTSFTIVSICIFFLLIKKKIVITELATEVFYILLFFLVFKSSSLILGFAIYFIFWHSIPSIVHQIKFISGDLSKSSVIFYVKKAAVYWIISIVGMFTLYILIPKIDLFATIIFVILFAVTAPHMWVMFRMKK